MHPSFSERRAACGVKRRSFHACSRRYRHDVDELESTNGRGPLTGLYLALRRETGPSAQPGRHVFVPTPPRSASSGDLNGLAFMLPSLHVAVLYPDWAIVGLVAHSYDGAG